MMDSRKENITVCDKQFSFYYTPAESKDKPILLIFHGHGYNLSPPGFRSPNFNVVCPIDDFGLNNQGSWYLGEHGNFFWLDAIQKIIEYIRLVSGAGRVFMWGSSMGGYASILHGRLNNVTAVYANLPQIRLRGTQYGDGWVRPYLDYVLGENSATEFNDLTLLFKTRSSTKYFLCFNQLETSNYFNEQCMPIIQALHAVRNEFYLEVRPLKSHSINHSISETINLFKKYHK